jgi:hypothetical protein
MPTFKPDLRCIGWSETEREAFGFRRDGLLEDENGCVIQNTVHHEPPIALQLRVAEMAFPKEYRPGVNSSVDVNHSGVVGIQHAKPANYSAGPPRVPPPPVAPQVLAAPEPEPEIDIDDLLGPELDPVETEVLTDALIPEQWREGDSPPIEVVEPARPVASVDAMPTRPARTPLEQDLYDKLAAARAKPKE